MKQKRILPGQRWLLIAIALVYVSAWFAHYGETPEGQYPIEEARMTLSAAEALAGDTANESIRPGGNSLYTYVLSIIARFSENDSELVTTARTLNALALLWITGMSASAAAGYWRRNSAVWIAGLAICLNPVLIFWAGEVSPALLAAACMSTAIAYLLTWLKRTKTQYSLVIGCCLTLAAGLQTTFLPLAILWVIFAFLYPTSLKTRHLFFALAPLALFFALLLLTNLSLQTPWPRNMPATSVVGEAYRALSSPEMFQGKSYALYKEIHPLLNLNPIHWGALFILTGFGFYVRLKETPWSPTVLIAIASLIIFAFSFALNDGGSQTRAGMIPLLAVFAAGTYRLPKMWFRVKKIRRRKLGVIGLCLFIFSYAPSLTSDASQTWEADYVYLANASLELEQNGRAVTWAKKALELNQERADMRELIVLAEFNEWALSSQPVSLPIEAAREHMASAQFDSGKSNVRVIRAIYRYKLRDTQEAINRWHTEKTSSALALVCLYWTGEIQKNDIANQSDYVDRPYYDLLVDATSVDRNSPTYGPIERMVDNMLALAY